eukprot:4099418-Prymnesium_polylepis.1
MPLLTAGLCPRVREHDGGGVPRVKAKCFSKVVTQGRGLQPRARLQPQDGRYIPFGCLRNVDCHRCSKAIGELRRPKEHSSIQQLRCCMLARRIRERVAVRREHAALP